MNIALVTTLDDSYIDGFLLTFNSILNSTPNFQYDLVILEWGDLSNYNKITIKSLYKNVIFKKVNQDLYKNHKFYSEFRKWNYKCSYRFDIFSLPYEKVIYFDCDMLFEISIDEILKYNFSFGACRMPNYTKCEQVNGSKIFNAGLMLIGEKYLNEKTRDELIKIADTPLHSYNSWNGNQPILNNYFLNKVEWLPNRFNLLSEDITIQTFNSVVNYHFIGNNKPWAVEEKYDFYVLNKIAAGSENIIVNWKILKKIKEKYDYQKFLLKQKGIKIN